MKEKEIDFSKINVDNLPEWDESLDIFGRAELEFSDETPFWFVCTQSGEVIAKITPESYQREQTKIKMARLEELDAIIEKATIERDEIMEKFGTTHSPIIERQLKG